MILFFYSGPGVGARRTLKFMKHQTITKSSGWLVTLLAAGSLAFATGCVSRNVDYVSIPPPVYSPPPTAQPQPPTPVVQLRSSADLDRMLAPIALYPDPLTAQILPAATLPEQIVLADRYVRNGGNLDQVDFQPWDPSVKALAHYPEVLKMMDDNLGWTTELGQAFVYQPTEVMDSIQRLRAQAQAIGNLRSTPQQTVVLEGPTIQIVPANPQIIYVPVYQPQVVYVQRPPPNRFYVSFSSGRPIGAWMNHDLDWRDRNVIVWRHDHPRPRDWWYQPPSRHPRPVVVNNVTVVNNHTTVNQDYHVWRPRADRDRDNSRTDTRIPGLGTRQTRPVPAEIRQPAVTREVTPAVPHGETRPMPRPQERNDRVAPVSPGQSPRVPEGRQLPLPVAQPQTPPQNVATATVPKVATNRTPVAPRGHQPRPPAVARANPTPPRVVKAPSITATNIQPASEVHTPPAPVPQVQAVQTTPPLRPAAIPVATTSPRAPRTVTGSNQATHSRVQTTNVTSTGVQNSQAPRSAGHGRPARAAVVKSPKATHATPLPKAEPQPKEKETQEALKAIDQ